MAVVLSALLATNTKLSRSDYELMSALDGTRGPDGFNHQFRKVLARAKEMCEERKNGGPVAKVKAKGEAKEKGKGKKRGKYGQAGLRC